MALGTSIFLSVVLVSVVALYIATKDRWNWKKLILWSIGGITVLSILAGIGFYIVLTIWQQPSRQNTLWGISLNAKADDVKFIKGVPMEKGKEGRSWIYKYLSDPSGEEYFYIVQFRDGKVRYIMYGGSSEGQPRIDGEGLNSEYQSIIRKFGKPSHVDRTGDELERMLSFAKYNVFFWFKGNRVVVYGIYDASSGPIKFTEAKKKRPKKSK